MIMVVDDCLRSSEKCMREKIEYHIAIFNYNPWIGTTRACELLSIPCRFPTLNGIRDGQLWSWSRIFGWKVLLNSWRSSCFEAPRLTTPHEPCDAHRISALLAEDAIFPHSWPTRPTYSPVCWVSFPLSASPTLNKQTPACDAEAFSAC